MNLKDNRLVVVSNRLPVSVGEDDAGSPVLEPGAGGLVTAVAPILGRNNGVWIGWPGGDSPQTIDPLIGDYNRNNPYQIHPVYLDPEDVEKYYYGFANEALWPLLHDLLGTAQFDREEWEAYERVNRKFAEAIAEVIQPNDFIWIHDYHLFRVAYHLRELGVTSPLAFFLHTPFPAPDLFRRLPWRDSLMEGMVQYDLLGFHTLRDRRNFVSTVRELRSNVKTSIKRRHTDITLDGRTFKAGNFPISIDFDEFDSLARTEQVQRECDRIRDAYPAEHLILGLDRLDYTKGIPERFLALERLLEKYPDLVGKVSLVQVVVPSRTRVQHYKELKEYLDRLTGRINGRFTSHGYVPISYFFKRLARPELIAHYLACDVALITPLRDGMNLVAKEYAAANVELEGTLVLSEFTGAADQLARGSLMVNPYDLEDTADKIYQALTMDHEQRAASMKALRRQVRSNDVHQWVRWFMDSFDTGEGDRR